MKDDILSTGGGREPGPWPRRIAVAVGLAVFVVLAGLRFFPHHHAASAAHRAPHPASSTRPVTGNRPGSFFSGGQPDGIAGPTLPWTASLRLPVAGSRPAWFFPATGQVRLIGGLRPDPAGFTFTWVGGGWAIQPGRSSGCGSCRSQPVQVYFLPEAGSAVRDLGTAVTVAPGAASGTLWLTRYPSVSASGVAQLIRSTGPALGRPVLLPPGQAISRGTDQGLLLQPAAGLTARARYRLWDPASRRFGRTFSRVIAASAGAVAWLPACVARPCQVLLARLHGHATGSIALPRSSSVASAAFSPDSRYLALQLSYGAGGDSGALAMQLEVAGSAGGKLTVVPGTWASSDAVTGFGWPDDNDALVAELGFMTKVQLASWHPGNTRPGVAVIARSGPTALVLG